MPALDDDREEMLAQEIAKGASQAVAYVNAGYPAKDNKVAAAACSRLLRNRPIINERVTELKILLRTSELNEKFKGDIEQLTQLFFEDRNLARQLGQPSAAISALNSIAKMHGRMTDTVKHQGDADNPVVHEIRRTIVDTGNPDS